jgi:lysozyme family protein
VTPFEEAVAWTIHQETGGDLDGALHTDPDDAGGTTRWGISQRAYPTLDVAGLTRVHALLIAERDYWRKAGCDRLPGPVAVAHFDCAFASGPYRATVLLQELVGAESDGHVGDETIGHLAGFMAGRGARLVASQLVIARARWLCNLMDDPDDPAERKRLKYIEGWVARLVDLSGFVSRLEES